MKKALSIILALLSCFILCNIAFANGTAPENDSAYLVDAKIVRVPLKNRISFRQLPESPKGITVELTYSDGTTVTDKIALDENGYCVNGESVIEAEYTAVEKYGIKNASLFMNEGELHLSYKYLCLPTTIGGLFQMFFDLLKG